MQELFTVGQLKRYFNILDRLNRMCCPRYVGYNKRSGKSGSCEQEVFVNRTLNKWFSGKYLVYIAELNGREYKRYVCIAGISFGFGYSDDLEVVLYDYASPKGYSSERFSHNDLLYLEGEWHKDGSVHKKVAEMFDLPSEEKEFTYEAYDWSKYKNRGKKEDRIEKTKTTVTVKARTIKESFKKARELEKENPQLHIHL